MEKRKLFAKIYSYENRTEDKAWSREEKSNVLVYQWQESPSGRIQFSSSVHFIDKLKKSDFKKYTGRSAERQCRRRFTRKHRPSLHWKCIWSAVLELGFDCCTIQLSRSCCTLPLFCYLLSHSLHPCSWEERHWKSLFPWSRKSTITISLLLSHTSLPPPGWSRLFSHTL